MKRNRGRHTTQDGDARGQFHWHQTVFRAKQLCHECYAFSKPEFTGHYGRYPTYYCSAIHKEKGEIRNAKPKEKRKIGGSSTASSYASWQYQNAGGWS